LSGSSIRITTRPFGRALSNVTWKERLKNGKIMGRRGLLNFRRYLGVFLVEPKQTNNISDIIGYIMNEIRTSAIQNASQKLHPLS
jgi:hypothetical protein